MDLNKIKTEIAINGNELEIFKENAVGFCEILKITHQTNIDGTLSNTYLIEVEVENPSALFTLGVTHSRMVEYSKPIIETEREDKFSLAYNIVIAEFFADAEKAGMTYEQAQEALVKNKESIASITKGVMETI